MKLGIVGSGTDKFTTYGASSAKAAIARLLGPDVTLVSGHSPMGGVDLWAEEIAAVHGWDMRIFPAEVNRWEGGYKERNLRIAQTSDKVCVIVADSYPPGYDGRTFRTCYHCIKDRPLMKSDGTWHVKSGACWTAREAQKLGKPAEWLVVKNER